MALEQLETFLVGFSNFDTLSTIVGSDRANVKHSGTTGGDCLTDVVKSDLKAATIVPTAEKLLTLNHSKTIILLFQSFVSLPPV